MLSLLYLSLFLTSCIKDDPIINNPIPIQKIVQWKFNVNLSEFANELYVDPLLYKEWILIGFITDRQTRNLPTFIAFDKKTGEKVWQYVYPGKNTDYIRNMKIFQHLLLVKYTDRIICFNLESRQLVWEKIYHPNEKSDFPMEIYGEFLYQGQEYYDNVRDFPFNDSVTLVRYHILSGKLDKLYGVRKKASESDYPLLFPSLVVQDGNKELIIFSRYYLSLNTHKPVDMFAIDIDSKEVVWKDSAYSPYRSSWNTPPYIFERSVIGASDWSIYSWDAATGKLNWKSELKSLNNQAGFSFSGPFVHGNKVYAIENDGHMFCLDASTGSIIWQNINVGANNNGPARGPCIRPIIVDDILYVNTWSDQAFILFDANTGKQLERYRDADYNGRNVLYDEETKTFFVTADDQLRAFTVKR
ncbi:MAG: PQQ-binding-like beta-propeller repeat protein [Saprospiraceae bacterium]